MSKRYRITREYQQHTDSGQGISLEECRRYFATKPDFTYSPVFIANGETTMTIEGDFFMWSYGEALIPFRYYQGDIYVSGSNDAVIPMMMEVASELTADVEEG
ncbi:hypothetical protein [Paenibacillus harenae]|uniref:Uncharacterized protein n=1 Tax=Paenibacillus harenae TaxID=306543 RepID=A0ABT9UAE5_PAEHA|nr:hypothetical protein [Paenibacillus harenae]MDQ0059873.1 hypothetical protein [Paenibacillus harenae]MDQ0116232.1 hypothetical protein [Paenibacillus harenae]